MKIKFLFIALLILMAANCGQQKERSYQGYVEGENVYLASPNSGRLMRLYVHRGDQVKKGQLLFSLDADPQILVVKQNEADLLEAQKLLNDLMQPRRSPEIAAIQAQIEQTDAQLKLAEIRVQRTQQLYAKQAIDKDSVDEAVALYKEQKQLKAQYESNLQLAKLGSRDEQIKAQQAQVISLTAKLAEAKWQLEQKTVYAPNDGFIFDTYYREGEFVGSEQSVLSLLPPENVRIEFFVPVQTLTRLRRGQEITFLCDGCMKTSEATINYISPEAQFIPPLVYSRDNSDKLVFRIKAKLKHPSEFKPGQPVSVFLP
ncbi:HlyD family secretion protein [Legionella feeleii]|nr:HlyD family efflux transporter periplasmic adaptor subunit [Legionella feeleii]